MAGAHQIDGLLLMVTHEHTYYKNSIYRVIKIVKNEANIQQQNKLGP